MNRNKLFKCEYHLVDHCNLKCSNCEHFSSIAEPSFIEIDNLYSDFNNLSMISGIQDNTNIYLLGGEPLLHPNLDRIHSIVRELYPNHHNVRIRVVTNGLLLPKMEESFWQSCKDNHIILSISKYPIRFDYNDVITKARDYGIETEIFHNDTTAVMRKLPIDVCGEQDQLSSFSNCPIAHRCCFLKNNLIYSCPRVPNICFFNNEYGYDLPINEGDFLQLSNVSSIDEIFSFLEKPKPFCKYCNTSKLINNIPWSTHDNNVNDWIL